MASWLREVLQVTLGRSSAVSTQQPPSFSHPSFPCSLAPTWLTVLLSPSFLARRFRGLDSMYLRILRRFVSLCQAVGNVQKWSAIHITEGVSRVQTAERNIKTLGVQLRPIKRNSIPYGLKHKSAILILELDEENYYLAQARMEQSLSEAYARTLSSMKLFILRQGSLGQLTVSKDIRFATWRITGFLSGVTEPAIEDLLSANESAWSDFVALYNAAGRMGVRLNKAFAPGPDFFPVFECSAATSWVAMTITCERHVDKFLDE